MIKQLVCIMVVALVAVGCGGGEDDGGKKSGGRFSKSSGSTAKKTATKKWDPALGTATIKGSVKFGGTKAPRRRPYDMSADEKCSGHYDAENPPLSETVIVNTNGTLQNVFVWVKEGLEDWKFPTPKSPVLINQEGCTFKPHVVGVQAGQGLKIRNSDPVSHNVHAVPKINPQFNFTQATQGQEDVKYFDRVEVCVRMKCDMHGWMGAWVGVAPHPYFAITDSMGNFSIPKLPPGTYTVEAWHEKYGTTTQSVTVSANGTQDVQFTVGK